MPLPEGVLRHVEAQSAIGHYWAFSKLGVVVGMWALWGIMFVIKLNKKEHQKILLDKQKEDKGDWTKAMKLGVEKSTPKAIWAKKHPRVQKGRCGAFLGEKRPKNPTTVVYV
ncbi:hypothetical protein HanRHA438_Chr03g0107641 [Helianthus annuus]|nr:hypothetical protein HanRHA438_Chr03g0107641 [Helianthus annuus]